MVRQLYYDVQGGRPMAARRKPKQKAQPRTRRASPRRKKANRDAKAKKTAAALPQQAPTASILQTISASSTDPGPVFDVIRESATRLCDAHLSLINLYAH